MVKYQNELESRILKWREGERGLGEARLLRLKKLGDILDELPSWAAVFGAKTERGLDVSRQAWKCRARKREV